MKAYRVACPGILLPGIGFAGGREGDPLDLPESTWSGAFLMEAPGEGAMLHFLDHGGPQEGSWRLRPAFPEAHWDEMTAAEFLPHPGDRLDMVARVRTRYEGGGFPGWKRTMFGCRPGGGFMPALWWELGVLSEGFAVEVRRDPGPRVPSLVIAVACRGGVVTVYDPAALARGRAAARMARTERSRERVAKRRHA